MASSEEVCTDQEIIEDESLEFVKRVIKVMQQQGAPDVEVDEWLKTFNENIKGFDDCWCPVSGIYNHNAQSYTSPMLLLLRECLLSHRWTEVASVLQAMMKQRTDCRQTVFQVCNELVLNTRVDNSSQMEYSTRLFSRVREISQFEIYLEMLLYSLHLEKGRKSTFSIHEASNFKKFTGYQKKKRELNMKNLFYGYSGLKEYVEFREAQRKTSTNRPTGELYQDGEPSAWKDDVTRKAEQAALHIDDLLRTAGPGTWDILVVKLHEIYVWMDEKEKALAVLEAYAAANPENANVHRYLYDHHQSQHNKTKALASLKSFCDAIPSDGHSLVLYKELLTQDSPHTETLPILMDLLDYGCWQAVVEPWRLLAEELSIMRQGGSEGVLQACWSIRESWWPAFHFTRHRMTIDGKTKGLIQAKMQVASLLMGPDHNYARSARKMVERGKLSSESETTMDITEAQ